MRREIPILITFIVGTIVLLANLIMPTDGGGFFIKNWADEIGNWILIVSAFAVGLATVNMFRIHSKHITRQRSGWINSLGLLVSLVVFIIIGVLARLGDSEFIIALNDNLYDGIIAPLGAAMFAMLAFYVASAAYRAFRMRSLEATVMLIAAMVVMLGKAPVGSLLWDKFPAIANWLMDVPNTVGQRAIMIGAAIGGFATSLRILLGIERGHLGGVE